MRVLCAAVNRHPVDGTQLRAQIVNQLAFILMNSFLIDRRKTNALQKPRNARQLQRATFIAVGQHQGLMHALAGRARTTLAQGAQRRMLAHKMCIRDRWYSDAAIARV